jgi:hypothetical protein
MDWVVSVALPGETAAGAGVFLTLVPPQLEKNKMPRRTTARVFILERMAF